MVGNSELKGYLGGFDLTDVLQMISQQQKTGILTVKSSVGQVALSFRGGQIVGINPEMANQEFDLEQMLKKSGKLPISRLNNLRQEQVRRHTSLEKILVEHEVMNAEEIGSLNLLRVFEALECILRWEKGSYSFQPTAMLHETPYLPPQPSDFVLFEILRQMDELSVFEQQIPSVNSIFESVSTFASETNDDLFSEDFKERLSVEEQHILELVSNGCTVQDIIDKSSQGKYHVYRILHSFLESGIIAQKGEKSAAKGRVSGSSQWHGISTAGLCILLATFILLTIVAFIPASWLPVHIPGRRYQASPAREIMAKYCQHRNQIYGQAKALLDQQNQDFPGHEAENALDPGHPLSSPAEN